jgi:hypothetical protein
MDWQISMSLFHSLGIVSSLWGVLTAHTHYWLRYIHSWLDLLKNHIALVRCWWLVNLENVDAVLLNHFKLHRPFIVLVICKSFNRFLHWSLYLVKKLRLRLTIRLKRIVFYPHWIIIVYWEQGILVLEHKIMTLWQLLPIIYNASSRRQLCLWWIP